MAYYPFVNGFNADRYRSLPVGRGGFYYDSTYRNQNPGSNQLQVSHDYVGSSRLLHVKNSNEQHTERYCKQNGVETSMPFYDFKPNRYCHSAMGHSDVSVRNKESHEIYRSTSLERGVDLTSSNYGNSNFRNNDWDNNDSENAVPSSRRYTEKYSKVNNNPSSYFKRQPFKEHKVKGAWVIKPTSNTLRKTFGSMNDLSTYSTLEPDFHVTVSTTNEQEHRQRSVNRNDTNVSYSSSEHIPKTYGTAGTLANKLDVSTSNTSELENSVIDRKGINVSLSANNLPLFGGGTGTNNFNVNVSTSNSRERTERYIDGNNTSLSFATDDHRVNNDKTRGENHVNVSTGHTKIHEKRYADKDDVTVSFSTSGNHHMDGEPKRESNVTISTAQSKVREIRNTNKQDVKVNSVVDRYYPMEKPVENDGGIGTNNVNVNMSASKSNEQVERHFLGNDSTVSFATRKHPICNNRGERRIDHVNVSTGHAGIHEQSRADRDDVKVSFSTSWNKLMHREPKPETNETLSTAQSKVYRTRNTNINDVKMNTLVDGHYSVAKSVENDTLPLFGGVVGTNNVNVNISRSKTNEQMERYCDEKDKTVSFATGEHRVCKDMEDRTDLVNVSTGKASIHEQSRADRDDVTVSISTSGNNFMHGEPKQESSVTLSSAQSKVHETRNINTNDLKVNTVVDERYSMEKSLGNDTLPLFSGSIGMNNLKVNMSTSKTNEQMERHCEEKNKTVSSATGQHRVCNDMGEQRTDHVNVSSSHAKIHEYSRADRDDVTVSFSTSGIHVMHGEPKPESNATLSTAQSKVHQTRNTNTNNSKVNTVVDERFSMTKSVENNAFSLSNGHIGTNKFIANMSTSKSQEQMERHFNVNDKSVSFTTGEDSVCNDMRERKTDIVSNSTGHTRVHDRRRADIDDVNVSFTTSGSNLMHGEPKSGNNVTISSAQSKVHQTRNTNTNNVKINTFVDGRYGTLPVGGMGTNDINVNVSMSNLREKKERYVDENTLAIRVNERQVNNNVGERRTDRVDISTDHTRLHEKSSVDRDDVTVSVTTPANYLPHGEPNEENVVTISTSNSKVHQTKKLDRNDMEVASFVDGHYSSDNDVNYGSRKFSQHQCNSENRDDRAVSISKSKQHSLSSNEMFMSEYRSKFTNSSSTDVQCMGKVMETKTISFPDHHNNNKVMAVSSNCPRPPISRSSRMETTEYKANFSRSLSKQSNKNSHSEKSMSVSHTSVDERLSGKEMQKSRVVNSTVSTSVAKQQTRHVQKTDVTKSLSYSAVDQYPWRQSASDLNNGDHNINSIPTAYKNTHKTVTFADREQRPWTSPGPGLTKPSNNKRKPLIHEDEIMVPTSALDNYLLDREVTGQHTVQSVEQNSTGVSKQHETSSIVAFKNVPTPTSLVRKSSEKNLSKSELSNSKCYQEDSFMMNGNSNSVRVTENNMSAFASEYQQQFCPISTNEHSAKIINTKSDESAAENDEVVLSYSAVDQYPWTPMKIRVPTSQLKHRSSYSNAHLSTSNTQNQRSNSLDRTENVVHSSNTGHNLPIDNAAGRTDMFSKVSTTTSDERTQCIENETGISLSGVFANPIPANQHNAEFSALISNKEQIHERTENTKGILVSNSTVRRRPKSAMGKLETEYTSAYTTKKSKNFSRSTIKKSDVTIRYKSSSEMQRRCKSAIGIRPTSARPTARSKGSVATRPSSAFAHHKRCQSAQGTRHVPHPPRQRCKSAIGTRSSRVTHDIIRNCSSALDFAAIDVGNEIDSQQSAPLSCRTTATDSVAVTKEELQDDRIKITSSQFQNFKEMDRKMIGRMSKWQFGALLKLSGLSLTPKEVDQLWATLNVSPDGMYSYSSLIKHFVQFKVTGVEKKDDNALEDTRDLVEQAKRVQRERKERKKVEKEEKENKVAGEVEVRRASSTLQQNQQPPSRLSEYPPPGSSMSVMSTKSVRTKELLVKIKKDVVSNWEGLKSVFKFIDKSGFATITIGEMRDVMNTMNFSLTAEEKDELCQRFDLQRNGRFHYLEFMKCFSQRPGNAEKAKTFVYSKHTHKLEKKQDGMDVTVANVLCDMRDKFMKEHKNLRRAFKKLDLNRKGYLSVQDFRKALKLCKVDVSNEDFYHLMTEFDKDITGRISYDNFLTTFIDVA